MEKKIYDIEDQDDQIYQFEEMDVDIIVPQLMEEQKHTGEEGPEDTIQKQLQQLKETYIFRQKLEPSLVNAIRGKKGARREKKVRTIQFSNKSSHESKKQNIENLLEQRKNKEFEERIFLLSELKAPFECTIEVQKQGIFNLQPVYRLFNTKQSKFLLSSQKESAISSNFLFSSSPRRISKHQISYFGQLVPLDFLNNNWILYDHGFNPNKVREIEESRAQLLYARCESSCVGFSTNSSMKVITPSNLSLMKQYKPFQGENNLLQKYQRVDSSKILSYQYNRNNISQGFRKRLFDIPAANGFILSPEGSSTPLLYFGKRDDDKYSLEIHPPLSILQSFALCVLHLRLSS